MSVRKRCPVCFRASCRTAAGCVVRHRDKAGNNCPMSGKPFALMRGGRRNDHDHQQPR
jgi:hypothetical protein